MKRKLWLMTACCALVVGAASGQIPAQTGAKTNGATAYLAEAQTLFGAGNPEEALKAFQQAALLDPDNGRAVVGQYISLVQLKRVSDGIKVLDKWIAAKPEDPQRWFWKAMATGETGQSEESLKAFDELIKLQPDNGVPWIGKGQMLEALNRNDEALQAFDKATAMNQQRADVWSMKGEVQTKLNKYNDAVESYTRGINLSPRRGSGWYGRACVYALQGNKTNALADLKQAVELQPSYKEQAPKDGSFKNLSSDPDFRKLTE